MKELGRGLIILFTFLLSPVKILIVILVPIENTLPPVTQIERRQRIVGFRHSAVMSLDSGGCSRILLDLLNCFKFERMIYNICFGWKLVENIPQVVSTYFAQQACANRAYLCRTSTLRE